MTISVELQFPDDVYQALQSKAMACGQPLAEYAAYVLAAHVKHCEREEKATA